MRKFAIPFFLAVLCGLVLLFSIFLPRWKEGLVRRAERGIEEVFPLQVEIGSITFHFPSVVRMRRVSALTTGRPRQLLFSAPEARLTLNPVSLLRGGVELKSVALRSPAVYLVRDGSGEWNISRVFERAAGRARRLPFVGFTDARVEVVDFRLNPKGERYGFAAPGGGFGFRTDGSISVSRLAVRFGGGTATVTGGIGGAPGRKVRLKVSSGGFGVDEGLKLLRLFYGDKAGRYAGLVSGEARVEAVVDGERGAERVRSSVVLREGEVGGEAVSDCRARFTLSVRKRVEVEELGVRLRGGGYILGKGYLSLEEPRWMEMKAHFRDFPLAVAAGFMDGRHGAATGTVSGNVRMKGDLDAAETYSGGGRVTVAGAVIPAWKEGERGIPVHRAEAVFSTEGGVTRVRGCRLESDGIWVEMEGKIEPDFSFDLRGGGEVLLSEVGENEIRKNLEPLIKGPEQRRRVRVRVYGTPDAPFVEYSLPSSRMKRSEAKD
ncbi:MAG: hypothetical protein AB1742_07125 [bacterium]